MFKSTCKINVLYINYKSIIFYDKTNTDGMEFYLPLTSKEQVGGTTQENFT